MIDLERRVRIHRLASAKPAVHDSPTFWKIVEGECGRVSRQGKEFALVLFRVEDARGRNRNRVFGRWLAERIRSVDAIGRLNEWTVGVLLPSTTVEGGERFAWRVARGDGRTSQVPFAVYSYPQSQQLLDAWDFLLPFQATS